LGTRDVLKARSRQIFLSGKFPELTAEHVNAADADVSQIDDDRAFVSLDDRQLVACAGHYLIYGSEYLCGVAAALGRSTGRDYRQVLKQFGRPTLFHLRIPFDAISNADFTAFVDVVREHVRKTGDGLAPRIDFTLRLRQALPPGCVAGHRHPRRIIDPLLGMTPYYYRALRPESGGGGGH